MTERCGYTLAQIEFLREGYMTMNARDLARAFNKEFGTGKSAAAIKAVLRKRGIRCGRHQRDRLITRVREYTREHVAFLQAHYPSHPVAELTRMFNDFFGMDKTPGQIKSLIYRKGILSGRDGMFREGNRPWNDGTKGQGLTGANPGSFRKGNVPYNTRDLGSERIDSKDGYILVKVAEPNPYTGADTRFKQKHVHVYEQHHGEVPDGMVVIFMDGDKRNFDPDNLAAVTRSELARLNQYGYSKVPEELKQSVLAMIRLKTRAFERMKE